MEGRSEVLLQLCVICVVSMRVCVNELHRCETIDFALDERDVSTTASVVPT